MKPFSFHLVCTVCIVHLKMAPTGQPSFVHTQLYSYFVGLYFICSYCAMDVHSSLIAHKLLAAGSAGAQNGRMDVLCSLPTQPPPLPHQVWCVTYKPLELQTKVREDSQSRRRLTLGPSPGWKHLLVLSHIIHYKDTMLNGRISVLNLKALIGAFNQEKALVWAFSLLAFSVIVKSLRTLVWSSSVLYCIHSTPAADAPGSGRWRRWAVRQGQSPGDLQPGLSPALAVRPRLIFRTSEFSSLHWGEKTKNISPVSQHCWPKRPDSRWSNHNSFSCKGSL